MHGGDEASDIYVIYFCTFVDIISFDGMKNPFVFRLLQLAFFLYFSSWVYLFFLFATLTTISICSSGLYICTRCRRIEERYWNERKEKDNLECTYRDTTFNYRKQSVHSGKRKRFSVILVLSNVPGRSFSGHCVQRNAITSDGFSLHQLPRHNSSLQVYPKLSRMLVV